MRRLPISGGTVRFTWIHTGTLGGFLYPSVFGIQIHHHLPFWWDIGAISVFSLIVFYYAVHSRLGPEKTTRNVAEAVSDAHLEELDLQVAEIEHA